MEEIKYGQLWARHSELVEVDQVGKYRVSFEGLKKAVEEALRVQRGQPSATWLTGQYDRLYDQVKSGKRTVCYVDYNVWGTENVYRDICTIRAETMEFSSRGHGYGTAKYMSGAEKELFIQLCESIHVEWLDESGAATAPIYGPNEYPDLSSATPEQKAETISGLIELAAKEVLKMFYAFGLKTHIECTVINDPTKEEFDFIFRKKGAAPSREKEVAGIDELWDEHSEHIDDDIDSLSRWAGSAVVDKEQFKKLVAKLWERLNNQKNKPP